MLTAIRKCFALVERHHGRRLTLAGIPEGDAAVYDRISRADTMGVFQIESRAQMSMLPRLKPRCYYDLVIEVAIVRPGPIQGQTVHPYWRRRAGKETVTYPNDAIRDVLRAEPPDLVESHLTWSRLLALPAAWRAIFHCKRNG